MSSGAGSSVNAETSSVHTVEHTSSAYANLFARIDEETVPGPSGSAKASKKRGGKRQAQKMNTGGTRFC